MTFTTLPILIWAFCAGQPAEVEKPVFVCASDRSEGSENGGIAPGVNIGGGRVQRIRSWSISAPHTGLYW
jgi:hypothetical protein